MKKKYYIKKEGNLFRIFALRSFGDVRIGEPGGLIEFEHNLSHEGTCWINYNARVTEEAQVFDNVIVQDLARVYGRSIIADSALIRDKAKVFGHCRIYGEAIIRDSAEISGDAEVSGKSVIQGKSAVCGSAKVSGVRIVTENIFN